VSVYDHSSIKELLPGNGSRLSVLLSVSIAGEVGLTADAVALSKPSPSQQKALTDLLIIL
jgi:hypothetical protein